MHRKKVIPPPDFHYCTHYCTHYMYSKAHRLQDSSARGFQKLHSDRFAKKNTFVGFCASICCAPHNVKAVVARFNNAQL